MREHTSSLAHPELRPLLELTHRVGIDPLLTQASTGNTSIKLHGVLWIKASGKRMAAALREDIFVPLDLHGLTDRCLRRNIDPIERFPNASVETAMHAALPNRVVLHVHCVNTIAWAVRTDAQVQIQRRMEGIRCRFIPYIVSGLPLAAQLEHARAASPDTNVFVLGNHGLVIGGEDERMVEELLHQVKERLAIPPRQAHHADYSALSEITRGSDWELPEDDGVHNLGTDTISQAILEAGLLYPCQAIFSDSRTTELFRPIPCPLPGDDWQSRAGNRTFLIVQGRGVIVRRSITSAELAMISGLAEVVRRLDASSPLRYLTRDEVAGIPNQIMHRYRDLARANPIANQAGSP